MMYTKNIGNMSKVVFVVLHRCQTPSTVVTANSPCAGLSLKAGESGDEAMEFRPRDKFPPRLLPMQLDARSNWRRPASRNGPGQRSVVGLTTAKERGHRYAV
jgi:hypothetical protein